MTSLIRIVRRRARGTPDEGGFALIVVLAAMLLFGVVVLALLSLSMTSMAARQQAVPEATVGRAADAALETWINQVRNSPNGVLGALGDDGQPVDCTPGGAATPTPINIGATAVTMYCTGRPVSEAPIPNGVAGNTALYLTQGFSPLTDLANVYGFGGTIGSAWPTFYKPALDQLNQTTAQSFPGLIHWGPGPLTIDKGAVVVNNGSLLFNNVGNVAQSQEALNWRSTPQFPNGDGKYLQATKGVGAENFFGSYYGPPCGLLDPNFRNGVFAGLFPFAVPAVLDPIRGTWIKAPSEGIQCGDPASVPGIPWPAPASWTPSQLSSGTPPPACPAQADRVVTFSPGAYNAANTAVLNGMMGTGATKCPDRTTFWFPPGDYYFDSSGLTVAGDLSSRGGLTITNPTARVVFGAPNGWCPNTTWTGCSAATTFGAQPSNFPKACATGTTAQGVSITLSSRTTIKHRAGLFAACAVGSPTSQPALVYQQAGNDVQQWAAVPNPGTVTALPAGLPAWQLAANLPNSTTSTARRVGDNSFGSPTNWPDPPDPSPALNAPRYNTDEGSANRQISQFSCTAALGFGQPSCTGIVGRFTFPANPGYPAPTGDLDFNSGTRSALYIRADVQGDSSPPLGQSPNFVSARIDFASGGSCQLNALPGQDPLQPGGNQYLGNNDLPRGFNVYAFPLQGCLGVPMGDGLTTFADASQLEGSSVTLLFNLWGNACYFFSIFVGWICPTVTVNVDYLWYQTWSRNRSPSGFEVTIEPQNNSYLALYGGTYLPRSQVGVSWKAANNSNYLSSPASSSGTGADPVFGAGLVASSLISYTAPDRYSGSIAGVSKVAAARLVQLNAVVDGQLRATALVRVVDNLNGTTASPGRRVQVQSWRTCKTTAGATPQSQTCP